MLKGYFIQYKFIIPETTKHSSYTYQKLFRALYGYTQNVTKSNGKAYRYYRKGILSNVPYLRPGKNCVIIPPKAFALLDSFFKTGKNPSHYWRVKGDWKAVFYLDEKNLNETQVISAILNLIERTFEKQADEFPILTLTTINEKNNKGEVIAPELINLTLNEVEKIISLPWFKEVYQKDEKLKKFYLDYISLKK